MNERFLSATILRAQEDRTIYEARTRRLRTSIVAAPTRPVPNRSRLLGSGVTAAVPSNVKLVIPVVVLVRLNVPAVAVYPDSVKVPVPIMFRNCEVSETIVGIPVNVKLTVLPKMFTADKITSPIAEELKLKFSTLAILPINGAIVPVASSTMPAPGAKVIPVAV